MRWGILINLAAIFLISGLLLFLVFCAALHRAVVDDAIEHAFVLADALQRELRASRTPEAFWDIIKRECLMRGGLRPVVYDGEGRVLGGCGIGTQLEAPVGNTVGRRVRVLTGRWLTAIFESAVIVVDSSGDTRYGAETIRGSLKAPSILNSSAFTFFAAYLLFTQVVLFFVGYILFHRTVLGPIKDAAGVAAKAAGMADVDIETDARFKGDIQRISAGLRAMVARIVDDRQKMGDLIQELRRINEELRTAQEGLIRSEKMAGIGRLAAGIAHEIGNPLQILMGYVELVRRRAAAGTTDEISNRMEQELKRIHEILQGMLEFARPASENKRLCDVNALVAACGTLLQGRKAFRSIDFEQVLDPDLPKIVTEPEKLRQVLINLLFNAVDAMEEGRGKIILRTGVVDNGIVVRVKDSGRGIPKEDLNKIFDPFFTTKDPGKGTGLGLTVSLALMESLGGTIEITSEAGQGTIVTVRLPAQAGTRDDANLGPYSV